MKTPPEKPTDAGLISAFLAGRSDAQRQLFEMYFTMDKPVHFWVYQKAYWIPASDKEDVLNDIYLAVINSLPQFEFRSALSTYINRIARRKCLDAMPSRLAVAKGRRIKFVDIDWYTSIGESIMQLEDPDPNSRPDRVFTVMEEEQAYLLHSALRTYSGCRCRDVLQMYIREMYGELTRKETARLLGVSIKSMNHMIHDCMYRLKRKMLARFRDYEDFINCVHIDLQLAKPNSKSKRKRRA